VDSRMCSWSSWFAKTMVLFTPMTTVMLIGSKEILFAMFSMPSGIITWTWLEFRRTEDVESVKEVVDVDERDDEDDVDDDEEEEDVERELVVLVREELVVLDG
jgi:hypothetical protein